MLGNFGLPSVHVTFMGQAQAPQTNSSLQRARELYQRTLQNPTQPHHAHRQAEKPFFTASDGFNFDTATQKFTEAEITNHLRTCTVEELNQIIENIAEELEGSKQLWLNSGAVARNLFREMSLSDCLKFAKNIKDEKLAEQASKKIAVAIDIQVGEKKGRHTFDLELGRQALIIDALKELGFIAQATPSSDMMATRKFPESILFQGNSKLRGILQKMPVIALPLANLTNEAVTYSTTVNQTPYSVRLSLPIPTL